MNLMDYFKENFGYCIQKIKKAILLAMIYKQLEPKSVLPDCLKLGKVLNYKY